MKDLLTAVLVTVVVGCACSSPSSSHPPDGSPGDPRARGCLRYSAQAVEVGTTPEALPELSGLAASRRHPDVFWAHNDSGSALELFAISGAGEVLARLSLSGVSAPDIEDVAVGPCDAGGLDACIYLADTGDNLRSRGSVQLLRLLEPKVLQDGNVPVEALAFQYPEGPRDAEALVVDARGVAWVITKSAASLGEVYRLDGLQPGGSGAATKVGEIHAPFQRDRATTAADLHPDGERLLLRTYARVWELRRAGATGMEELISVEPTEVPSAPQIQGEAIAFSSDGGDYLLGSEGAGAALFRVICTSPPG